MKQIIVFILVTLSIIGCQDVKNPEKPKNLITKDKMVAILTETYLVNAARSVDNKSMVTKGINLDSLVYKKFGVDSLQFVESNDFYAADVNVYREIFQDIETKLSIKQQKMDSIRKLEIARKDSISKLLKKDSTKI